MSEGTLEEARPGRPSNSLHFVVGEMSGKLDQVLSTILQDRKSLEGVEVRVSNLEAWQSRMLGGGAVVVTLLGSWEVVRYVWRG